MLFKRFESLTSAFPPEQPTQPPEGIFAFCRHYTKGFEKPLLAMTILGAIIAMLEVSLFGFMGQMVDWLSNHDKATFLAEEGWTLFGWSVLILVGIPILLLVHNLLVHQTLLGNYPMAIRWLAHRFLLRQSVSFYQDEFSGRIATKVMQTALAVRESVMKLADVAVYISVYFLAMLVMIGSADLRLMLPLLLWLLAYIGIQLYFCAAPEGRFPGAG